LLIIELLKHKKSLALPEQMKHVWTELRDNSDNIAIEDPANPTGNDLSELFSTSIKLELSTRSRIALDLIERQGWEQVFGPVPENLTKAAIVTGYTARSAASFGE
jgi:hypothetical protein